MIIKETFYSVSCDECGEMFEHSSDGDYAIFKTEEKLKDAALDYGWEFTPDDDVTCENCVVERDKS